MHHSSARAVNDTAFLWNSENRPSVQKYHAALGKSEVVEDLLMQNAVKHNTFGPARMHSDCRVSNIAAVISEHSCYTGCIGIMLACCILSSCWT